MGLRGVLALLRFFTAIPIKTRAGVGEAAKSFHLIPLIGLLEGVILGCVLAGLRVVGFPSVLAACIAMAIHAGVTGCLHLDGFIDYSEAVASRRRGDEALRVMKDPRKGAFALVTTTIFALSWFSATCVIYSSLDPLKLLGAVIVIYVASSESMFVAAHLSNPEPYQGLGRMFVELSKPRSRLGQSLAIACSICVAIAVLTHVEVQALATAAGCAAATLFTVRDSRMRLGYANGDVLGFCYELARVASLFATSVVSWCTL